MAPGIIWRRHINQLRPTTAAPEIEPDLVEVSQPEVVSLPPASIQQSAPLTVVGTVPENPMADQPEMVSVAAPVANDPPEATPVSSTAYERRYPQRARRAPQRLDL